MSDASTLVQIVEGALLAAGKPLTVAQLEALFEDHERPAKDDIRAALTEVGERCEGRGYELVEVASGFRFQVREHLSPWIGRLWHERPQRYSRALLETLALIAYRQPITRGEIEEIRGVAVSTNIIKTLHEREWIRVVGHRDVPGRPAMYATTRQFLDYFNLKSLDQLPALADARDVATLNAELGFAADLMEEDAPSDTDNEAEAPLSNEESLANGQG
jgi:segregation and condensation protein B